MQEKRSYNFFRDKKGQSLVEVIIAMAIFSLITAAMVSMATGGFVSLTQGGEQTEAEYLAQEAIEAVRSIRDNAWNEIIYTTSSVSIAGNLWQFDGEGLTDSVGQYTRSIHFDDVCRDSSDNITACPGSYTDVSSKKVTVRVVWEVRPGVENEVEQITYLTNWDSRDWVQTDWSGGNGQSIWSDITKFDSDDGNIDYATAGEIKLVSQGGSCGERVWTFSTSSGYIYDNTKIEVTGDVAQLIGSTTGSLILTGQETSNWGTGYCYEFSIENVSGSTVYDWQIDFDAIDFSIYDSWSSNYTENAGHYIVTPESWNQQIASGQTITGIGFCADISGSNYLPVNPEASIPSPEQENLSFSIVLASNWSSGYCADIHITNNGTSTVYNWLMNMDMNDSSMTSNWSANYVNTSGDIYEVTPLSWNNQINPGQTITSPGFCADKTGVNYIPTVVEEQSGGGGTGGIVYPDDSPSIEPDDGYTTVTIDNWSSFTETATKNGGEVYYQLSYDNGSAWYYWNGSSWSAAGTSNYNTASVVNANINSFSTSTGQINFKAFLSSDGSQQVQLDEVVVSCSQNYNWDFNTGSNYNYNSQKIEVDSSVAKLILSGGGGISGVEDNVVDILEYDTSNGLDPDIIHVSGNIYLIAFRGSGNDGWVKTVNVDNLGNIGASIIDSLEFDNSNGYEPSLIQINATIYAVAYRGTSSDGFVKTFTVDGSGNIGNSTIDSLEFDTSNCLEPDIIQVGSGYYAVAYRGVSNDGFVRTFTIDGSGNIGNSVIDSLEWDPYDGYTPDIIQVGSGYYAVAYRGSGNDGFVATFTIDGSGNIGNSVIDSLEWGSDDGFYPDILNVSGDVYVVAYSGIGNDGFATTFSIDSSGNVGNNTIDTLEYNTNYSLTPDIKYASGNIFLIISQGSSNPGVVEVDLVDIATNGDIAGTVVGTWQYSSSVGTYPKIINLDGLYWAFVYSGSGSDGFVGSLKLAEGTGSYPDDNPDIYPTTGINLSSSGLDVWNDFTETATKNGGEVYYQLSYDNGSTWYYWNGSSWSAAGTNNYNTASVVNANINSFSTSTGQINFKAFLSSDGSQQVELDRVEISWSEGAGGGSGSGYATSAYLISSAFNMSDLSPLQLIDWDEDLSSCDPACDIKFQLRLASDSSGSPGTWTSWFGTSGVGTYFINPLATLISKDWNWYQWVQYRVELSGDGTDTPVLQEVRVNYK